MKFTEKDQFLAFLMKRRCEIIYGGSASHLNERIERYKGMSPKEWINNELEEFLIYQNPASLLFKKTSGFFLSAMYGQTYNLSVPTERELLFRRKSWLSLRWYKYQQNMLKSHGYELIQSELVLCLRKLSIRLPFACHTEEELRLLKK